MRSVTARNVSAIYFSISTFFFVFFWEVINSSLSYFCSFKSKFGFASKERVPKSDPVHTKRPEGRTQLFFNIWNLAAAWARVERKRLDGADLLCTKSPQLQFPTSSTTTRGKRDGWNVLIIAARGFSRHVVKMCGELLLLIPGWCRYQVVGQVPTADPEVLSSGGNRIIVGHDSLLWCIGVGNSGTLFESGRDIGPSYFPAGWVYLERAWLLLTSCCVQVPDRGKQLHTLAAQMVQTERWTMMIMIGDRGSELTCFKIDDFSTLASSNRLFLL